MNPISITFSLLLFFALCSSQILANEAPTPAPAGDPELIAKTCKLTLYNDLCKQVLESDPESNGADLKGLLRIALETASNNATSIFDTITKMQNETKDTVVQQCLTDCSENYQDAIDQLLDSITAMDFKGYDDVKSWVSAAMSDAQTCEQGFQEKQGTQTPISKMNAGFDQVCSIALAIVKLLA